MKKLPDIIKKNRFVYTNVCRGKRSFVFEQHVPPNLRYYEVFRRRVNKEFEIGGNIIPESEAFPSDNSFGVWAWSFRSLDKAMEKYKELENADVH